MIKLLKENNKITISGHAGGMYGEDIVCASASAIVYTTINAIEKLRKGSIKVVDGKNMEITILTEDENVNKLILNMLDLFKALEEDYPNKINVKES